MKITTWNVNGIQACRRKGLLKYLSDAKPDILCCQEIKTQCTINTPGYVQLWNPAKRNGYSGTMVFTRRQPLRVIYGFGVEELDEEGRIIAMEFEDCWVVNVYAPSLNIYSAPDRPDYRAEWDHALRSFAATLEKPAILCGDFNVAHTEQDIYPEREKSLKDQFGFCTEERERFSQLLSEGYLDAFRTLYPTKSDVYSWWSPKNHNRVENRGSRLDYFLVSEALISCVQDVRYMADNTASDHCPVSMTIVPDRSKRSMSDEDLAVMWRSIDWDVMEEVLAQKQKALAQAAYDRNWPLVDRLQRELVDSLAAKVLAVKAVLGMDSGPGVDGVKWETPEQKMKAAFSLTARGYRPLPYLHKEIAEVRSNGEHRIAHIPVAKDRAMQALYRFALDPVAESTADHMSFSARKFRSPLDLHAYLTQELEREGGPEIVVLADVTLFYDSANHQWLLRNIPMDKSVLRKFLKAGFILQNELFAIDQGISLGTSLSPVLGNMMLDGLQTYLYDHLYPKGGVEYPYGHLFRFADDMAITAGSWAQADQILEIVSAFLRERGLRISAEKARAVHINEGFDYVGRHYQKVDGILMVTPSGRNIQKKKLELAHLILDYKGSQRSLIEAINKKLAHWASAQRTNSDAYFAFRDMDSYVNGLLVKRLSEKYKRWKPETVRGKFWIKEDGFYVFVLPEDHTVRVERLAPAEIVWHKPVKSSFNFYLDMDYTMWLKYRRMIQKHTGKYASVWRRQGGRCAYCGQSMLPDQDVTVVEKSVGQGRRVQNLLYIHSRCGYDVFTSENEGSTVTPPDFFELLEDVREDAPEKYSPYLELTDFFHRTEETPLAMTFQEIENILGDDLDWEAYFYEAFWLDELPGNGSPLWQEEGFPFHAIIPSPRLYCISDSWTSQGYEIKALHLDRERVVFRKKVKNVSGLMIPRRLLTRKLPDQAVYEANAFFKQLTQKYGL